MTLIYILYLYVSRFTSKLIKFQNIFSNNDQNQILRDHKLFYFQLRVLLQLFLKLENWN